jgi:hypothetical protein
MNTAFLEVSLGTALFFYPAYGTGVEGCILIAWGIIKTALLSEF